MSLQTHVTLPGHAGRDEWLSRGYWLPRLHQMLAALRFDAAEALDPFERNVVTVSMRQGIGMIVVLGLIAGVVPLVANLWLAISLGTSVPLAQIADTSTRLAQEYAPNVLVDMATHTVQTIAGAEPRMPGVLAAILSALGVWLNTPLSWLAVWMVYGAFVMGLARLMGAANTLQVFYAGTSFAAVPLVLTGLTPIPLAGPVFGFAGSVWAALLYYHLLRYVTKLDVGRALLSMLLPIVVAAAVPTIVAAFVLLWLLF